MFCLDLIYYLRFEKENTVSQAAFRALLDYLSLIAEVDDSSEEFSPILQSYISFMFREVHTADSPFGIGAETAEATRRLRVYEAICLQWRVKSLLSISPPFSSLSLSLSCLF